MDLPVSKNAPVWTKTATTLKDACCRQKVNYGSKLICYVSVWKDIKVCIIISTRVKSSVLKKEIRNENICHFCKESVFHYYFVFYVFSFVSVTFLFKNLRNCFLFFSKWNNWITKYNVLYLLISTCNINEIEFGYILMSINIDLSITLLGNGFTHVCYKLTASILNSSRITNIYFLDWCIS